MSLQTHLPYSDAKRSSSEALKGHVQERRTVTRPLAESSLRDSAESSCDVCLVLRCRRVRTIMREDFVRAKFLCSLEIPDSVEPLQAGLALASHFDMIGQ